MIRLFLVDDHELFLSGVRTELHGACDIVGTALDADTAAEAILAARPDVVLLDVHLPGGGGVEVLRQTRERLPGTRFLALSVSDSPDDVIGVIRAGARGYVTKTITPAELVEAIQRIHDGDAVFSPRLAGFVLDAFAGELTGPLDPELDQLTPREREVLRLIARGYAYKQVARRLEISIKTVESHLSLIHI